MDDGGGHGGGDIGPYFIFLAATVAIRGPVLSGAGRVPDDIIWGPLELWLAHLFNVLGGYAVATGVLTIALAATSLGAHSRGAANSALIGGATSLGLMAAVNFTIDSDLKWVLLGRSCSLVMFWLETRNEGSALTSESPASRRVLSSDAPST
jgi:hypothetical protein